MVGRPGQLRLNRTRKRVVDIDSGTLNCGGCVPMADPPAGAPDSTNTLGTATSFSLERFEPSILPRKRRRPRNGDEIITTPRSNSEFAVRGTNTGQVTNQEVRQLINSLKETINQQTAVIKSTKADLLEVKNDQEVLKIKNEELQEVRALRLQTESLPKATPPRSWAAIAASASDPGPQTNDQQSKKEQNQVQVSTSHSQDSDQENNGDNSSNSF